MKLIALSGYKGSGKDTVANHLHKEYGYTRLSFASALKDTVALTYGIPREDLDNPTKKEMPLFQYPAIPTDLFTYQIHARLQDELSSGYWTPRALCILEGSAKRSVHANFWVRKIINEIMENSQNNYVITDLRYKSEVDTLKMLFPEVELLRIVRPSIEVTTNDPSERDLDDYPFPTQIGNLGNIEELNGVVDMFMQHRRV